MKIHQPSYVSAEAKHQERDLLLARSFADEHPNFDDTFLSSLEKQFLEKKFLTERQYDALRRTIDGWHMEEWRDE